MKDVSLLIVDGEPLYQSTFANPQLTSIIFAIPLLSTTSSSLSLAAASHTRSGLVVQRHFWADH